MGIRILHWVGGRARRLTLRTALEVVAAALVLTACGQQVDLADQRARQLMRIWETGDSGVLDEIASPDIVYDDVPNGERFEGLDGVRRYVGHVHSWASQVEITVVAVHSGSDGAVVEWVMRGVQNRPIPGRVPLATNRPFELKGVTLVVLRDGRITRAADYIDVLGFVVQLGSRVELPGGVVIPPDSEAAQQGDAPAGARRRR